MNRPTVLEMECFLAVGEELNFSRAAARLHLSQPPITRHIQSLEHKLGCRLLERNTRRVALTSEGRLYLDDVRRILFKMDAAWAAVRRVRTGEPVRLRAAFVGALLDEVLVRVLQRFRMERPDCQLQMSDLSPSVQMEALAGRRIDLAFIGVAPREVPDGIKALVWKREPLRIALPAGHRLARARFIRFAQLADEGWILVSREAAPGFRDFLGAFWDAMPFVPRVVGESERIAAVLTMVAANQGVSVVPDSVARLISEGVVFRPIAGDKPPLLEHSCLFPAEGRHPEREDFVALLAGGPRRGTVPLRGRFEDSLEKR